jgi:hypothetical protein
MGKQDCQDFEHAIGGAVYADDLVTQINICSTWLVVALFPKIVGAIPFQKPKLSRIFCNRFGTVMVDAAVAKVDAANDPAFVLLRFKQFPPDIWAARRETPGRIAW